MGISSQALTVSQINLFVKSLLEGDGRLEDILVMGELSNFTDHYQSGHLYFSLKDSKSVLKAVMFSSAARRLKFRPENGLKVIIRGRVSVYEPSGVYQLYAEEMQPQGIGALNLAYEQLKQRLEAEGLFRGERKRRIPAYPEKIGVITSPTGAAVRDILQITARRWPVAQVVLCPVQVQGAGAAQQMVAALEALNRGQHCDVILLGRGGGSTEDLWAFNEEILARAVANSKIPVISAVGHETDFTIVDFVADLRAPTPSGAAELATPSLEEELDRLAGFQLVFQRSMQGRIGTLRQQLDRVAMDSPLGRADAYFSAYEQEVRGIEQGLGRSMERLLTGKKGALALAAGRLDALSPLKVLGRGYAIVTSPTGTLLSSVNQLEPGAQVLIRFGDGQAAGRIESVTREQSNGEGK